MKLATLTFIVLSVAGAAYAQSDHQTFTQPIAGPTTDPCTGEPLTYSGECKITVRTRTDADGTTQVTHTQCTADGAGVFGRVYQYRASTMDRTESPVSCGFSQKIRQRERFNSAGGDQNFFITFNFQVVTDEFCQTQIVRDETETNCTGKSGGF